MTPAQADQIIDFLYGMHRPPDQDATRRAWRMQLSQLDPDLASKAAIEGMQTWQFFPRWAEFFGRYKLLERVEAVGTDDLEECPACGGDKLVLVSLRPPRQSTWMHTHGLEASETEMLDEYAPCPLCNTGANTSFHRSDGVLVQSPDPAQVRRMMES